MKGNQTTTSWAIILMVLGMAAVALITMLIITEKPPPDYAGQAAIIATEYEGRANLMLTEGILRILKNTARTVDRPSWAVTLILAAAVGAAGYACGQLRALRGLQ
jgi:hypothetical protein